MYIYKKYIYIFILKNIYIYISCFIYTLLFKSLRSLRNVLIFLKHGFFNES